MFEFLREIWLITPKPDIRFFNPEQDLEFHYESISLSLTALYEILSLMSIEFPKNNKLFFVYPIFQCKVCNCQGTLPGLFSPGIYLLYYVQITADGYENVSF